MLRGTWVAVVQIAQRLSFIIKGLQYTARISLTALISMTYNTSYKSFNINML